MRGPFALLLRQQARRRVMNGLRRAEVQAFLLRCRLSQQFLLLGTRQTRLGRPMDRSRWLSRSTPAVHTDQIALLLEIIPGLHLAVKVLESGRFEAASLGRVDCHLVGLRVTSLHLRLI